MDIPFIAITVFVAVLILLPFYRVLFGPTLFDRVIGAGLIGTKGAVLLALLGFVYGRIDMFIDLALVYTVLNFIGTIATGKYLEKRREGKN